MSNYFKVLQNHKHTEEVHYRTTPQQNLFF